MVWIGLLCREWRYFFYEPKIVNFVYEAEPQQSKEEIKGIELPQFSSAAPPDVISFQIMFFP